MAIQNCVAFVSAPESTDIIEKPVSDKPDPDAGDAVIDETGAAGNMSVEDKAGSTEDASAEGEAGSAKDEVSETGAGKAEDAERALL